jgi:hypothetical protein
LLPQLATTIKIKKSQKSCPKVVQKLSKSCQKIIKKNVKVVKSCRAQILNPDIQNKKLH